MCHVDLDKQQQQQQQQQQQHAAAVEEAAPSKNSQVMAKQRKRRRRRRRRLILVLQKSRKRNRSDYEHGDREGDYGHLDNFKIIRKYGPLLSAEFLRFTAILCFLFPP